MDRVRALIQIIVFAVALLLAASPATSIAGEDTTADTWAADYEQLTSWEFSAAPVALPAGGIRLQRDTAEWLFESGTVRTMRPTSDGAVTGLVFEGQGRFRMEIPDVTEANQLTRFTGPLASGESAANKLEYTFSRLVLRTTDDRVISLFPPATGEAFEENPLARECHLHWLGHGRFDADARVVAGCLVDGDEYLAIDMDTAEHGWLFYEFDGWRMEEIRLCQMPEEYDFVQVWLSLDRSEHRRPDGRPGSTRTPLVDLLHADLEVDLMGHSGKIGKLIARGGRSGISDRIVGPEGSGKGTSAASLPGSSWAHLYPMTRFRAKMEFRSEVDGLQALPLRLNPWAGNVVARDAAGNTLPVLRAHTSERFPRIIIHEEDTSTVVLLREPLARGETVTVDMSWERRTANYPGTHDPNPTAIEPYTPYLRGGGQDWHPPLTHAGGRYWYPEPLEGWNDRHTARLTIVHPKKLQVRGSGTPAGGSQEGKRHTSHWVSEAPLKAAAFSYGYSFQERRIIKDGLPEVIASGPNDLMRLGDETEIVAAVMADSIEYFQDTFGYRLPLATVTGTYVTSFCRSQSFSGFITFKTHNFFRFHSQKNEMRLAQKTAELFWGEQLDWESYRDQWLIRALTELSAEMYLEAKIRWTAGGDRTDRELEETIEAVTYRRPYASTHRYPWLGPLGVGFRDRTPEAITRRVQTFSMSFSSNSFNNSLNSAAPLGGANSNLTSPAVRSSQARHSTIQTNSRDPRYQPQLALLRHSLRNYDKRREVLYMLRSILRNRSDDGDEQFVAILADFLNSCAGKTASTRDFIAAVERNTGEDWGWFFDQWVYSSDVPNYNWAHTLAVEPDDDGLYLLEIWIEQGGVAEDFRMPVTFGLEYEDAKPDLLHLEMDQLSKTFPIRLPNRPVNVTFDPYHDLLFVKK